MIIEQIVKTVADNAETNITHNILGIDVETHTAKRLCARLRRLKSTFSISIAGTYPECRDYCQLHIITTLTEDQLDHWLWKTNHGAEYVGVFTRQEETKWPF